MSKSRRYQRGKPRRALILALAAALILALVVSPLASAAARKLPVYSVKRDDKCVSLTFDAAWGDVRVRSAPSHGVGGRLRFLPWMSWPRRGLL